MTTNRFATVAWLFLITLTIFTYSIGQFNLIDHYDKDLIIMVILSTIFIKGITVTEYFMDLHPVKLFWRIIPVIYIIIVCLFIWILF